MTTYSPMKERGPGGVVDGWTFPGSKQLNSKLQYDVALRSPHVTLL